MTKNIPCDQNESILIYHLPIRFIFINLIDNLQTAFTEVVPRTIILQLAEKFLKFERIFCIGRKLCFRFFPPKFQISKRPEFLFWLNCLETECLKHFEPRDAMPAHWDAATFYDSINFDWMQTWETKQSPHFASWDKNCSQNFYFQKCKYENVSCFNVHLNSIRQIENISSLNAYS